MRMISGILGSAAMMAANMGNVLASDLVTPVTHIPGGRVYKPAYISRSRYMPHQGTREMQRRRGELSKVSTLYDFVQAGVRPMATRVGEKWLNTADNMVYTSTKRGNTGWKVTVR